MPNKKGMRPAGSELTALYKLVTTPYAEKVKTEFKWEKGEKKRALQAFIMFCEAQGIRDREFLEEMMADFSKYINKRVAIWVNWDKADRNNYLGFLFRNESIAIYCAKKDDIGATDTEMVGTGQADEWSF